MTQTVPGFDRLTVEPDKLGGQPCIRGYRFSAQHLLELLAAGNSFEQIHEHFEFLEADDVRQVLGYAAELADRDFYLPSSQSASSPQSTQPARRSSSSVTTCSTSSAW